MVQCHQGSVWCKNVIWCSKLQYHAILLFPCVYTHSVKTPTENHADLLNYKFLWCQCIECKHIIALSVLYHLIKSYPTMVIACKGPSQPVIKVSALKFRNFPPAVFPGLLQVLHPNIQLPWPRRCIRFSSNFLQPEQGPFGALCTNDNCGCQEKARTTIVISSKSISTLLYMGVSKNSGTPKSSILIGFSMINHPFWGTTIFGNTHILEQSHPWWIPHLQHTPVSVPVSFLLCHGDVNDPSSSETIPTLKHIDLIKASAPRKPIKIPKTNQGLSNHLHKSSSWRSSWKRHATLWKDVSGLSCVRPICKGSRSAAPSPWSTQVAVE